MIFRAAVLLAVLSLSGCSFVNTVRMMYANDDLAPVWQGEQSEQVFEAVYLGDKPYINVSLNGEQLLFLIDTGASFSMLFDTAKGKKLADNKGYDIAIAGWGQQGSTPAYQTTIKKLSLGDVWFENVKLAFIPLATTNYYLSEQEAVFDGVIGHDLLHHFAWTFDRKRKHITASRHSVDIGPGDNALPMAVSFKKPGIPVSVAFNDKQVFDREVVIDTGSRHYFKFSRAFVREHNITFPASIRAADFGMSGRVEHDRVSLGGLAIGNEYLAQVKANIIPSDDEDDYWVIGSALMNQFVTVIDYHSSKFVLRPYEDSSYASRFNLSGIELRKLQSGRFIVRYISPDFDAANTSLAVGDEIRSIKGIEAREISESQWLDWVSDARTLELCIYKKQCLNIDLKHIEGYTVPLEPQRFSKAN